MQATLDVLVSDLQMPRGEDGFWLIAAIRAFPPTRGGQVPAVAVSGDVRLAGDRRGLSGRARQAAAAARAGRVARASRRGPLDAISRLPCNMASRGVIDPRRPALAGCPRALFVGRAVAAVRR